MGFQADDTAATDSPIAIERLFPGLRNRQSVSLRRIAVIQSGTVGAADMGLASESPSTLVLPGGDALRQTGDLTAIVVSVEPSVERALVALGAGDKDYARLITSSQAVMIPLTDEQHSEALRLLADVATEVDARGPAWVAAATAYLAELLVHLCRTLQSPAGSRERAGVWTIADVAEYVRSHYGEQFSLDTIAARCALSQSAFSREFKQQTGIPLFEFINTVRIQRACVLLKRTQRSVLEIAVDVGYNNVSFFNRYFRKVVGMSPTHYRTAARL